MKSLETFLTGIDEATAKEVMTACAQDVVTDALIELFPMTCSPAVETSRRDFSKLPYFFQFNG